MIMSAVVSIIDFDIFVILYRMGEPMTHHNIPTRLAYWIDFILVVPCGLLYIPLCLLCRRSSSPAPQAWWDLLTVEVAFWGCLLLSIEWGIALAVLLSLILTLQRSAGPTVRRLMYMNGSWKETADTAGVPVESEGEEGNLTLDEEEQKESAVSVLQDGWIEREVLCVRIVGNVMYFSIHTIQHDIKQLELQHYTTANNPPSPTLITTSPRTTASSSKEVLERLALGGSAANSPNGTDGDEGDEAEEDEDGRVEAADAMMRSPRSEEALRELEEGMDSMQLLPHSTSSLRYLLIDLVAVADMDTSGMRGLESMIADYAARPDSGSGSSSVDVMFVGGQPEVVGFLQRALLDEWERVGMKGEVQECFYPDFDSAMLAIQQKRCFKGQALMLPIKCFVSACLDGVVTAGSSVCHTLSVGNVVKQRCD